MREDKNSRASEMTSLRSSSFLFVAIRSTLGNAEKRMGPFFLFFV